MSQPTGNRRDEFLCPECCQNMPNMEVLQTHLQTVHKKQPPTPAKGLFSLAKQKIKSVQDNFKTATPNEPPKPLAQFFASNPNDTYSKIGYMRSYDDYFRCVRKTRLDQILTFTRQTLLRVELLTNTSEGIPRNGNSKERQKYEQNIVTWIDDGIVSTCASCSKSFGLFGRKHHCRLDGRIICTQCSQYFSFSNAQWIIELNASPFPEIDEVIRLRLNNLLNITSSIILNDGTNEENLRICLPCAQFLQKNYDKIRFRNIEKDVLFQHYEKIVQAQSECQHMHSTYSIIIESILNGETNYQLSDAQHLYEQLNLNYNKIDSTSRIIAKLADSKHENDRRYIALCRNIRTYSVQVLQKYSASTKRVPGKDDFKRIVDERNAKVTFKPSQVTKSAVRQNSQVIQFVRQEESTDGDSEIVLMGFN